MKDTMLKVRLEVAAGQLVTEAYMLPFALGAGPAIVTWGTRVFQMVTKWKVADYPDGVPPGGIYREVFCAAVFTEDQLPK